RRSSASSVVNTCSAFSYAGRVTSSVDSFSMTSLIFRLQSSVRPSSAQTKGVHRLLSPVQLRLASPRAGLRCLGCSPGRQHSCPPVIHAPVRMTAPEPPPPAVLCSLLRRSCTCVFHLFYA